MTLLNDKVDKFVDIIDDLKKKNKRNKVLIEHLQSYPGGKYEDAMKDFDVLFKEN